MSTYSVNLSVGGNTSLYNPVHVYNVAANQKSGIMVHSAVTVSLWALNFWGGNGKDLTFQYYSDDTLEAAYNGTYYQLSRTGGGWYYYSDFRLKKDFVEIEPSLEKLLRLKPMYFNFRAFDISGNEIQTGNSEPECVGFIAQNVEESFPKCVNEGPSSRSAAIEGNVKMLSMTSMIPYIVKSVQEQQEIIQSQQVEIDSLKVELDSLKSVVQTLLNCRNATT